MDKPEDPYTPEHVGVAEAGVGVGADVNRHRLHRKLLSTQPLAAMVGHVLKLDSLICLYFLFFGSICFNSSNSISYFITTISSFKSAAILSVAIYHEYYLRHDSSEI